MKEEVNKVQIDFRMRFEKGDRKSYNYSTESKYKNSFGKMKD